MPPYERNHRGAPLKKYHTEHKRYLTSTSPPSKVPLSVLIDLSSSLTMAGLIAPALEYLRFPLAQHLNKHINGNKWDNRHSTFVAVPMVKVIRRQKVQSSPIRALIGLPVVSWQISLSRNSWIGSSYSNV